MKRTYCDHCGKEIKNGSILVEINIGDTHIEKHDICRTCVEEYITWCSDFFEERRDWRGK